MNKESTSFFVLKIKHRKINYGKSAFVISKILSYRIFCCNLFLLIEYRKPRNCGNKPMVFKSCMEFGSNSKYRIKVHVRVFLTLLLLLRNIYEEPYSTKEFTYACRSSGSPGSPRIEIEKFKHRWPGRG